MVLATNFLPTDGPPAGLAARAAIVAPIAASIAARARRFFRASCVVLAAAIIVPTPAAADYRAAQGAVETLVSELIAELRANEKLYRDEEKLFELIRRRVLPMVDTDAFSRLVLGRHWKGADDGQRRAFVRAMESQMVRSYGKSLTLLLEVDRVQFAPSDERAGGKYEMVMSSVYFKSNQPPLNIGYVVHETGGGWRIFDLVIDGLSLVKQFRRSFEREIDEYGLVGLIRRLDAAR